MQLTANKGALFQALWKAGKPLKTDPTIIERRKFY